MMRLLKRVPPALLLSPSADLTNRIMNAQPQRFYVPGFHLDPKKPCYCGSELAFGDCCATRQADRTPPEGVLVIENFLPPSTCNSFVRYANKQPRQWLMVIDNQLSGAGKAVQKRDPSRVTQHVELGKKHQQATRWVEDAIRQHAKPLGLPEWFERPQLLRYGPGGKYLFHADAEEFDREQRRFYRLMDRDFSVLIYLNDDYEGGSLRFGYLNFEYQPRRGDLLLFPSNHLFSHESTPITKGTKYALVSWGAFYNTPRVTAPPDRIRFTP